VVTTIVISIVTGLLVNEVTGVSPWLAGKVARWSAGRRYADNPARAAIRAEELTALISERPGNLLKLLTALGFGCAALAVTARRALGERPAITIIRVLAVIIVAPAVVIVALVELFVRGMARGSEPVPLFMCRVMFVGGFAVVFIGSAFGKGFGWGAGIPVGVAYACVAATARSPKAEFGSRQSADGKVAPADHGHNRPGSSHLQGCDGVPSGSRPNR
jgi:hypothetical protein